ncbi:unnamed protein product [Mortierella alpina]
MAQTTQTSVDDGDGNHIDNVCISSDSNAPNDAQPELPLQAIPKRGMLAAQALVEDCGILEKDSLVNPSAACTLPGSTVEAENHDPQPGNTASRSQRSPLELKNTRSGSGDKKITSASKSEIRTSDLSAVVDCCAATRTIPSQPPENAQPGTPSEGSQSPQVPSRLPNLSLPNAEPFDARSLEVIIQEHQDRTVQSFHGIARGLDRLNMELQFIFSEYLSRQYAQVDALMKSSLNEIQCQEKEQERLLNQMVSFLNAMKDAFAIFGGNE